MTKEDWLHHTIDASSSVDERFPILFVSAEDLGYGRIDFFTPSVGFGEKTHFDNGSSSTSRTDGLNGGSTIGAETSEGWIAAGGGGVFESFGLAGDFDVFFGEEGDEGEGCVGGIR